MMQTNNPSGNGRITGHLARILPVVNNAWDSLKASIRVGGPDHRTVRFTVLVIDVSGSMTEAYGSESRLAAAKTNSIRHIETSAGLNPASQTALVAFNESATIIAPPTLCSRSSEIQRHLMAVIAGGQTNLWAGLDAANRLMQALQCGHFDERLVHVLTDGWHNNGSDPRPLAAEMKKQGIWIDAVGIGNDSKDVGGDLLNEIASDHPDGGKRYRFIGDPQRLAEHYKQLAGHLSL